MFYLIKNIITSCQKYNVLKTKHLPFFINANVFDFDTLSVQNRTLIQSLKFSFF